MDLENARIDIEAVINKLGCPRDDALVSKAVALYYRKRIPINHLLAETLIAHYLRFFKGFDRVDIERNAAKQRCDVYAECGSLRLCVEIEFNFVPPQHSTSASDYLVARHVKKLLSIASQKDLFAAFAYPRFVVPSIPIEFLRPPSSRSIDRIRKLVYVTRRYFPIDMEDIELLKNVCVYSVYIFDLGRGKVYELTPQTTEVLITLYDAFLT